MDSFAINPVLVIRCLTVAALAGLLLAVGLRLTWGEVLSALQRCRVGWVLGINFVGVPAITLAAGALFDIRNCTVRVAAATSVIRTSAFVIF